MERMVNFVGEKDAIRAKGAVKFAESVAVAAGAYREYMLLGETAPPDNNPCSASFQYLRRSGSSFRRA